MELKKNTMQCYQQMVETTLSQEETLEAIVPDACPDMLRIVSITGQICIQEKQVAEQQILIKGQVDTTLLYLPEEGENLKKISLRLPFTSESPAQPLETGDEIFVIPTLRKAEARMLNPRKVLLRADIMLEVSGFQGHSLLLCCGVAEEENIQEQIIEREIKPLCVVENKRITFDETITLQGQGEFEEILSIRIQPICTESKLIGNKLIFKGETELQILYLSDQGEVEQSRHVLPLSQIMEIEDMGEEGHPSVSLILEGYYPSFHGGRTVDLTIDLLAQATVRGAQRLALLQDAYSTTHQLTVEKDHYNLVTVAEEFHVPQAIRQIFETAMPVQRVEDNWVTAGPVTQEREGNQLTFSCDLYFSLLCCDESGAWNALEFVHPLHYTTECPQQMISCCRCCVSGEILATPVSGGIEMRLTPQLHYSFVESDAISMVVSTTLGEGRDRNNTSVVLRLPQAGEGLWDIAKSYGSTISQIIQANDLEGEELPLEKMLLIPSMR